MRLIGNVRRNNHGRIQGRKGQALRKRRLARSHYLCEDCLAKDVVREATEVDHIVALFMGGEDVDSNTRNLCAEHHADKTRRDMGHKPKLRTGVDGWPE